MAIRIPRFLRSLLDVEITSASDGEVLTYDAGAGKWVNEASAGGGGGGTSSLPTANETGSALDTTTYDDTVAGSGKLTALVFPDDQSALAIAIDGDAFPRWIIAANPVNGINVGDGTIDPVGDRQLALGSQGALVLQGQNGYLKAGQDGGALRGPIATSSHGIQICTFASGSVLSSGSGAPTIAGAVGDYYFRTDTPSNADQLVYVCTVEGEAGTATWVAVTAYRPGGTDIAVADGGTGASTASAARTNLGLGSAATAATTDFDAAGAAAAAQAASQPLDSDLTAIAALSTTSFGRSVLALADAAALRTAAGLVIGTNVQAFDADLSTYAGITPSADVQSLLGAADYAAMRTLLGLVIGTDVQAFDAELAALAGLVSAANKLPYFTGSGTASLADLTAAGRALIDDADASAQRTTLGLAIGTNVQAYDAELAALAGLISAADKLPYFTGSGTADVTTLSSFMRTLLDDADAATALATLGATPFKYARVSHTVASNTSGGGATSGSWQTRTINTEDSDVDGIVSISGNQITLGAGTYVVRGWATAYNCQRHQSRFRNVTDSTNTLIGSSEFLGGTGAGSSQNKSEFSGRFTISGSKAFEVQTQVQTTQATNGYGVPCGASFTVDNEVYLAVDIWKIA